jgi:hypothetical protein
MTWANTPLVTRGYASLRTLVTPGVFYDSRLLRWQNRCSTPTLAKSEKFLAKTEKFSTKNEKFSAKTEKFVANFGRILSSA